MSDSKTISWFNRFYRVMIPSGLALFLITSYLNLTGSLQPNLDPNYPTGQLFLFRLAGAFIFGPISIGLGWLISLRFRDNLIGPVLIHWGCATSPNLGQSVLSPFWYALSLYYSTVVVLSGMVLMLASFPTGRGVTPFWDRVMKGLVLGLMGYFILFNLTLSFPVTYGSSVPTPSPLAIEALTPYFDTEAMNRLTAIVLSIFFFIGSSLTIYRYRITHSAERKQMRWLLGVVIYFAVFIHITTFLQGLAGPFRNLVDMSSLISFFNVPSLGISLVSLMFPAVVAISILRYRLFDIDLIIRRTLQYSVLSGLLGLTYFGLVIVLQNLTSAVGGQQSEFVTVLSTLAIAALFFPLRNRVQEFIDKRFFRKKYDAQKVLAEFAATCRDETDLDKLVVRLAEVIDETLQPEKVSVWIKPTASGERTSKTTQ